MIVRWRMQHIVVILCCCWVACEAQIVYKINLSPSHMRGGNKKEKYKMIEWGKFWEEKPSQQRERDIEEEYDMLVIICVEKKK
jgi:hypothetical protein